MKIKVNGKEKDLDFKCDKALLSSTLEFLGYKPNNIIVELNDLIIDCCAEPAGQGSTYTARSPLLEL